MFSTSLPFIYHPETPKISKWAHVCIFAPSLQNTQPDSSKENHSGLQAKGTGTVDGVSLVRGCQISATLLCTLIIGRPLNESYTWQTAPAPTEKTRPLVGVCAINRCLQTISLGTATLGNVMFRLAVGYSYSYIWSCVLTLLWV